jgi:hypothetical protein
MTRWFTLTVLLLACGGKDDTGADTGTEDTQPDTQVDTGPEKEAVWKDRRIETSVSLYNVYTGGTGAWVSGTGGHFWRVSGGNSVPLSTGVESDLNGIWGAGDGDNTNVLMVGGAGNVVGYSPTTGFSLEDLGTANFFDVDGTAGDLLAVGWAGAYHFNGTGWTFESIPGNKRLNGVFHSGTNAVGVGENGALVHRNGGVWTEVDSPTLKNLHSVHGNSATNVWAVGEEGTILSYDGSGWIEIEDSPVIVNLWGVWVASGGEVFVVGNNGAAYMYAADAWTEVYTGVDANLYAVSGSAIDNVWAVGNRGQVLRYTGPE